MDLSSVVIILNLILLESLLSIDNVAVLALLVKTLPAHQQAKALKYGIWGAYLFRFAALAGVAWLSSFIWLKAIGGAYLLWLGYKGLTPQIDSIEEGKMPNWITRLGLSQFWMTVLGVELLDFTFSIDNIFAAVAITPKLWIIYTGVGVGILAMRFLAQWFISLMEKYNKLAKAAYLVILLLGLKLMVPSIVHYTRYHDYTDWMSGEIFDIGFSICCIAIFIMGGAMSKTTLDSRLVNKTYD